jgi:hypothetical protein
MGKEVAATGTKVVLPIWHNISFEELQAHSPMLSGRPAVKSDVTLSSSQRVLVCSRSALRKSAPWAL